jgi:hypothetical protein
MDELLHVENAIVAAIRVRNKAAVLADAAMQGNSAYALIFRPNSNEGGPGEIIILQRSM